MAFEITGHKRRAPPRRRDRQHHQGGTHCHGRGEEEFVAKPGKNEELRNVAARPPDQVPFPAAAAPGYLARERPRPASLSVCRLQPKHVTDTPKQDRRYAAGELSRSHIKGWGHATLWVSSGGGHSLDDKDHNLRPLFKGAPSSLRALGDTAAVRGSGGAMSRGRSLR